MADDALPEQEPVTFDPIVHCIVFDASGRIKQSGACALSLLEAHAAHFGAGFTALEVSADEYRLDIDAHFYVLDGIIILKGTALDVTEYTIRADGADEVSFAVPAGTSVIHDGDIVVIEDHLFEFATDVFGDHQFRFLAPAAFYDFEVTIHAV